MKRSILLFFVLALTACGGPTTPVLTQISPAALTAPTFYENDNAQQFALTGERFTTGVTVLFGDDTVLQPQTVTATAITFNVPPSVVNPDFPQNPPDQTIVPVRVMNPNGQISNTVRLTVVPHCNPCGT